MINDVLFMRRALELAETAKNIGEVPVGAVAVLEDKIVGEGYNRRETDKSPLAHAEVLAIEQASKTLGRWRLSDVTLYVTLEPCPMCAGAITQARMARVVFGAEDMQTGCFGSVINMSALPLGAPPPSVTGGVLREECAELLRSFFTERRSSEG